MLHACNAVDGTAKKVYPHLANQSNLRFTTLLRDNYWILSPMAAPGIDLGNTRFPVTVKSPKAHGGKPDFADVIYGIHRCSHRHGEVLPNGFELIRDAAQLPGITNMSFERGKAHFSDRTIFGLLGVVVLSSANAGETVPEGYRLTYGRHALPLFINEWWGRAGDFHTVIASDPPPGPITLDFGEWTS
jgi:hypothetical protein